ncbi:hypothetical protein R3P38DRAFT_2771297 [Favolaschia claudopus]|uniref:Uncharacterized protein n=1 Tax=Favolaschia claudopus TaxID=2862362 RepID=A0AAW0C9M6_9AGAR
MPDPTETAGKIVQSLASNFRGNVRLEYVLYMSHYCFFVLGYEQGAKDQRESDELPFSDESGCLLGLSKGLGLMAAFSGKPTKNVSNRYRQATVLKSAQDQVTSPRAERLLHWHWHQGGSGLQRTLGRPVPCTKKDYTGYSPIEFQSYCNSLSITLIHNLGFKLAWSNAKPLEMRLQLEASRPFPIPRSIFIVEWLLSAASPESVLSRGTKIGRDSKVYHISLGEFEFVSYIHRFSRRVDSVSSMGISSLDFDPVISAVTAPSSNPLYDTHCITLQQYFWPASPTFNSLWFLDLFCALRSNATEIRT